MLQEIYFQIGRSLMSTLGFKSPTANYARSTDEYDMNETPLDWILQNQAANAMLAQQLVDVRHRDLPQRVVQSIARSENDANSDDDPSADCIKLLVCKSAPIIWGMQRAVFDRIDGKNINDSDVDNDYSNRTGNGGSRDGYQNGINEYFKYLPNVTEFKKHGDGCERRYTGCKIFPST